MNTTHPVTYVLPAPVFVVAPKPTNPLTALIQYEQGLTKVQLAAIKQAEHEAQMACAQAEAKYHAELQSIQATAEARALPLEAVRQALAEALQKREEAKVLAQRIWAAVNDLGQDSSEARQRIRDSFREIRAAIQTAADNLQLEQEVCAAGLQVDHSEREFARRVYEDAVRIAQEKVIALKKKYSRAAEILQAEAELLRRISQATTKTELDQLKAEAASLDLDIAAQVRTRRETLRLGLLNQLSNVRRLLEIDRILVAAKAVGELHHLEGPAARQRREILRQGWHEAQSFAGNLARYGDQVEHPIAANSVIGYWPGNVVVYLPKGRQWQIAQKYVYRDTAQGGTWVRLKVSSKIVVSELPKRTLGPLAESGIHDHQAHQTQTA